MRKQKKLLALLLIALNLFYPLSKAQSTPLITLTLSEIYRPGDIVQVRVTQLNPESEYLFIQFTDATGTPKWINNLSANRTCTYTIKMPEEWPTGEYTIYVKQDNETISKTFNMTEKPATEDLPDPNEVKYMLLEEAYNITQSLHIQDVADLLTELPANNASSILEALTIEIINQIFIVMEKEEAIGLMEVVNKTVLAETIEKYSAHPDEIERYSTLISRMNKTETPELILKFSVGAGSTILNAVAEANITKAAIHIEETIEKALNESDPQRKEELLLNLVSKLETFPVPALVELLDEIVKITNSPSYVAELLTSASLDLDLKIVSNWIDTGDKQILGEVLNMLPFDTMRGIWQGLEENHQLILLEYLSQKTIGELPGGPLNLSELIITPTTIEYDGAVTIKVVLENPGFLRTSQTVTLMIDDVEIEATSFELEPGNVTTHEWVISSLEPGSHIVKVLNKSASFTVQPSPLPPSFKLTNLGVSPTQSNPDKPMRITFTVTNTGERKGNYTYDVKIDGEIIQTITGSIDGGESKNQTVKTNAPSNTGSHTIEVESLTTQFKVIKPLEIESLGLYVLVGISVILILLMLWTLTRKKPEPEKQD
jgi:hypothetical protein